MPFLGKWGKFAKIDFFASLNKSVYAPPVGGSGSIRLDPSATPHSHGSVTHIWAGGLVA
jgi:hypothetical protein